MTDRILRTLRLTMTPHGLSDYADICAMWADPAVVTFLGGRPHSAEESWQRLLRYAGSWALLGFGFWCVREVATGDHAGDIGFLDGHRTGVEGFDGDPEIGWSLATRHQGRGHAAEAVAAALAWGRPRFRRTVAMIHPDNTPSLRVAERAGFRHFADSAYKDQPTTLWEYIFA